MADSADGLTAAFDFATAARIHFGVGRAGQLREIVGGLGRRALVCTGSTPSRSADLLDGWTVPLTQFPCPSEPTVEQARQATAAAREVGADVVVAIGGGSVLDLGKATAMLLANGGDPLDYLEVIGRGQPIECPAVPFVAVPTTAGTGAEVTANAVLSSPEHGLKGSLRSTLMIPRLAVVDPLLAVACTPAVTAASGLDALTQCLEPLVSPRATPLTDSLAREGLRRAARGLRAAHADGSNISARGDLALCALCSGMALANAKLGAVHGFAAVLGGAIAIPHGTACAALLVPVVTTTVQALRSRAPDSPALARYEEAAALLTGRPDATVEDGLDWMRETLRRLDMPSLGGFGIADADADADEIVAQAARASSMQGHPISLREEELHAILRAAT